MSEKMKANINLGIFIVLILLTMVLVIIGNQYMFVNDQLWVAYTAVSVMFGLLGYHRSRFLFKQAVSEYKAVGDTNEEA